MKAGLVALAFLLLLGVGLVLLLVTGLLEILLLFLGLLVFVVLLAGIVIGGLVLILALPYYFVAKKAAIVPGSYGLEQIREK